MQRVLLLLITVFALYACSSTSYQPVELQPAAPILELAQPIPGESIGEMPAPETTPLEFPAPITVTPEIFEPPIIVDPNAVPHIALLLPMHSPSFAKAADAVQKGFMAAAEQDWMALPVRVYSNFDENNSVVTAYRQAIANGAVAVIGPLTRNGVSQLADYRNIPVPTLCLNVTDTLPAPNLFFFGMDIESEARQLAELAIQQDLHQAIIISTHEPLSKRLQAAFEDEWHAAGGTILREIEFANNPEAFSDFTDIPGMMVFLATDGKNARLIRPYLSNVIPIYATSRVYSGNDNKLVNYDLYDIHFVDMPWLLSPDHPAVMIYPRANPPLSADLERLYALGIDAYRLIQPLLSNRMATSLILDGVSGQIQLRGHAFHREATPATFVQGQALISTSPAMSVIQMFPEQSLNRP